MTFKLKRIIYLFYIKLKALYYNNISIQFNIPISVFIPVLKKDLVLLPTTIIFLKKNLKQINEIVIVAPNENEIIEFCKKNHLKFINENDILPLTKNDLNYGKRNGWLFQQLLKFSSDLVCKNHYILVWDSDTILTQKLNFFDKQGRQIFYASKEYHQEYFDNFNKIFGTSIKPFNSFITHSMLFNKSILRKLKNHLQNRYQKPWYQVIVDNCNKRNNSCFSEYETYVNFIKYILKEKITILYWSNIELARNDNNENIESLILKYRNKYKTISFHSYLSKPKTKK